MLTTVNNKRYIGNSFARLKFNYNCANKRRRNDRIRFKILDGIYSVLDLFQGFNRLVFSNTGVTRNVIYIIILSATILKLIKQSFHKNTLESI